VTTEGEACGEGSRKGWDDEEEEDYGGPVCGSEMFFVPVRLKIRICVTHLC